MFGVLAAIVLVINLPVIMTVLNALQTTEQLMTDRSLFPTHPTLANFLYLNDRTPFWTYLLNSMEVSFGCAALSVVAATLAGYALSRFKSRFLTYYSRSLFVVQMFPIILALIPLFVLFRNLGLINNPLSVIVVYTVVQLPFATWMARSFFDTIPDELEEAALVDGCSRFGAFLRIVVPLSGPGIAAISIFSFLFSYNEFFVANIFSAGRRLHDAAGGHHHVHAAICDGLGKPDGGGDGDADPDVPAVSRRAEIHRLRRRRQRREGVKARRGPARAAKNP